MNYTNITIVIYIFLLVHISCSSSDTKTDTNIVYDQRQSGKFNIHINIKDMAIIDVNSNEFVDDSVNDPDEYYYDEDDLTVKPLLTLTPSQSEVGMNYSQNYTLSEKEQLYQLDTIRNKSNMFNFTTSIQHSTEPRKDFLKSLVKKPVLMQHNESKDNPIPVLPLKGAQQNNELNEKIGIPSAVHRKENHNSKIISVLSGLFGRSVRCNDGYKYKNNRNCNKIKQSPLFNRILRLMQLIRTKDD